MDAALILWAKKRMEMTPDRWNYTTKYLRDTFGACDEHLAGLMEEGVKGGLPDIAVSADVGRLLMLMTSMTKGRLAIEVGTLGGFSAIWLARGLREDGKLITIEPEEKHADFAQAQFERAGVANKVELRRGFGIPELERLVSELQPGSVDVLFMDAIKTEYPKYWSIARSLVSVGGLLIADNILGSGNWWIDQEGNPARDAAAELSKTLAQDEDFEAVAVPLREGLLIARRLR